MSTPFFPIFEVPTLIDFQNSQIIKFFLPIPDVLLVEVKDRQLSNQFNYLFPIFVFIVC